MTKQTHKFVDFGNPPVIETVLGVQFNPLKNFSIAHHGLFWGVIRANFSKYFIKPALNPLIEEFEEKIAIKGGFELIPEPEVRSWFANKPETRLIQVQKDRFHYNWKKVTGDEVYPSYDTIKPEFKEYWEEFTDFLKEENLGSPEITQCEITYLNQMEIGKELKSYGEAHKVVALFSGKTSGNFLPKPETANLNTSYLISGKKGRLRISIQPAIRRQDAKEVLQLNLTARGAPSSSNLEDILEWFDLGHEWIVKGFADFTTKDMHKIWRRTL